MFLVHVNGRHRYSSRFSKIYGNYHFHRAALKGELHWKILRNTAFLFSFMIFYQVCMYMFPVGLDRIFKWHFVDIMDFLS